MSAAPARWGALFSGGNAPRTLVLAGGVALHAVNLYIATTILPSVVRDIGGLDYYAWSTTLFVAASILGASLSGGLLGRTGVRGAYGFAAALFAAGSLACGLAPAMPVLLAGRCAQGLGGGILLALSYAMIRLVFAEALWPRAMGLVSAMWGAATLVGPAVGGLFAEWGAWRAAFWSLVPVTGLFVGLAASVLPRDARVPAPSPLAWRRILLLTTMVMAVSAGSVGSRPGWNLAGLAGFGLLAAWLVRLEAGEGGGPRLFPTGALRPGTKLNALYAMMSLLAVTVTTSEIFAPLFLQRLQGRSPLVAGYLAALMSGAWSVGSVASAGMRGPATSRALIAAPLLGLAGMAALAILVPAPSAGGRDVLLPICLALMSVGFGVGLAWPHLLTRALQAAPAHQRDLAASSLTSLQLFATALAAALAGMVANLAGLSVPGGVAGTAAAAFWLFAVFAAAPALGLVTAVRIVRHGRARDVPAGRETAVPEG